jgi:hypothetical protein
VTNQIEVAVLDATLEPIAEQGGSLFADYALQLRIRNGDRLVETRVDGWYHCGWIAPGASADLDGSGLALWGTNQPGGWSVCDNDGQTSGRPSVEVVNDQRDDGRPVILISGGHGRGDTELTCAALGVPWPDEGDNPEREPETSAALGAMEALAAAIGDAMERATPSEPDEPSAEEQFDYIDDLDRGWSGVPVRFGPYRGATGNERIAVRIDDEYRAYHPGDAWRDAVSKAASAAAIEKIDSLLAVSAEEAA